MQPGPEEGAAALRRPVSIDEDQGQLRVRFDLLPGVALEQLSGSDPQGLFQTQEVIRAQDDGGGLATLVKAGQIGVAMEREAAVQGQAFLLLQADKATRFPADLEPWIPEASGVRNFCTETGDQAQRPRLLE